MSSSAALLEYIRPHTERARCPSHVSFWLTPFTLYNVEGVDAGLDTLVKIEAVPQPMTDSYKLYFHDANDQVLREMALPLSGLRAQIDGYGDPDTRRLVGNFPHMATELSKLQLRRLFEKADVKIDNNFAYELFQTLVRKSAAPRVKETQAMMRA